MTKQSATGDFESTSIDGYPFRDIVGRQATACLCSAGYATYGAVIDATDDELLAVQHVGPQRLLAIREDAVPFARSYLTDEGDDDEQSSDRFAE